MKISVLRELEDCKKLWDKFSPKQSIWDDWEIMYSFFDPDIHELYFLLTEDKKGMLPLWYDQTLGRYYYFGGCFGENRKFWFDLLVFRDIFEKILTPTLMNDVNFKDAEFIIKKFPEFKDNFNERDYRYYLDLGRFGHDLKKYLACFGKKHRKNLLYDLRKFKELNYEVKWQGMENFNKIVEFNVKRFGKDSDFSDPLHKKEMKAFFSALEKKGMLHSSIIKINGSVEAMEFSAFYNEHYYVLNGGYNREIRNIGKLLIMENIKKSIELKAKEIDFLVGDTGWKELWNFDKELCYTFRKY